MGSPHYWRCGFALTATALLGFSLYRIYKRRRKELLLWTLLHDGVDERVVEIVVKNPDADEYNFADDETVEIPAGLLLDCTELKSAVCRDLGVDEYGLIELLHAGSVGPIHVSTEWEFAPLVQLTYWYDRRAGPTPLDRTRKTEAKFGRWTAKIPREQIIYSSVALKSDPLSHLGQPIFRRPQGIDITRLSALKRGAMLSGHTELLELVHSVMNKLKPENCARIPIDEVKRHNRKDDIWLIIDKKVYDVTSFMDIHPGGEDMILQAANGEDAALLFEQTHGEGLRYSLRLLNQFFIGFLEGGCDPVGNSEDFLSVLREITTALHTFDDAKATGDNQRLYGFAKK